VDGVHVWGFKGDGKRIGTLIKKLAPFQKDKVVFLKKLSRKRVMKSMGDHQKQRGFGIILANTSRRKATERANPVPKR